MKIAVVGSREFSDKPFVERKVEEYLMEGWVDYVSKEIPNQLISGGAKGVDSWAEEVARDIQAACLIFPAEWEKYGKRAGFIRNELIINEAEHVVAFWDGTSKGTKHSIDLAIKAGKPIDIYVRR